MATPKQAAQWKDTTSYSRSDAEPRTAREWTFTGSDPIITIEVTIHRHMHHPPTTWLLSCRNVGVQNYVLGRRGAVLSAVDAQHAALARVEELLSRMSADVRRAMGEG